jgi:hypothetical protein
MERKSLYSKYIKKIVSPTAVSKKHSSNKCSINSCVRKLRITEIVKCKCGKDFCLNHRDKKIHNCTFDYKSEWIFKLSKENQKVVADKFDKI